MNNEDTIIIGAGAAGLAAAITLGRAGKTVVVFEKNTKAGKKILVSGNGKCNITNQKISTSRFHGQAPEFISHVLQTYDFQKIKTFFDSLGLALTEGKSGQMFPMSLQASTVVELLLYEAQHVGVKILYESAILKLEKRGEGFYLESNHGDFNTTNLIIASGSPAAPQLGGTEDGYAFAKSLGHTITALSPALVQLCSDASWVKRCAGVKIPGLAKLYANGEYISEKKGDLLFTNYGISGLAILDISREASTRLGQGEYCDLVLDLLPGFNKEQLTNMLLNRISSESHKHIELWLYAIMNKKIAPIIIEQSKCIAKVEKELNRKEIGKLVYAIKNLKLPLSGTKGYEGAEVTAGGVKTTEVGADTMESKIVPNLYFAGEILDVDGDRGGFNFHFAWASGLSAGKALS